MKRNLHQNPPEPVTTFPLTPRQQRFVREYLKDCNATKACTRAGYLAANANVTGPRLLHRPQVAAAIAAAGRKLVIRDERALRLIRDDLIATARFDPIELFTPGTTQLRPLDEISANGRRTIAIRLATDRKNPDAPARLASVATATLRDRHRAIELLFKQSPTAAPGHPAADEPEPGMTNNPLGNLIRLAKENAVKFAEIEADAALRAARDRLHSTLDAASAHADHEIADDEADHAAPADGNRADDARTDGRPGDDQDDDDDADHDDADDEDDDEENADDDDSDDHESDDDQDEDDHESDDDQDEDDNNDNDNNDESTAESTDPNQPRPYRLADELPRDEDNAADLPGHDSLADELPRDEDNAADLPGHDSLADELPRDEDNAADLPGHDSLADELPRDEDNAADLPGHDSLADELPRDEDNAADLPGHDSLADELPRDEDNAADLPPPDHPSRPRRKPGKPGSATTPTTRTSTNRPDRANSQKNSTNSGDFFPTSPASPSPEKSGSPTPTAAIADQRDRLYIPTPIPPKKPPLAPEDDPVNLWSRFKTRFPNEQRVPDHILIAAEDAANRGYDVPPELRDNSPKWVHEPRPHSRIIGISHHFRTEGNRTVTPRTADLIEANNALREQHAARVRRELQREADGYDDD